MVIGLLPRNFGTFNLKENIMKYNKLALAALAGVLTFAPGAFATEEAAPAAPAAEKAADANACKQAEGEKKEGEANKCKSEAEKH